MPSKKPVASKAKARLGSNLKKLRVKVGLTQEQVAESIGVSPRYVQALEAGEYLPSLPVLGKLKNKLKADWNQMFDGCDG